MSRGVGWQSALWARPLYRGPVAKRVAVSAGGASLRSVKKTLSEVESLTSLCPLFPSLHVLRFFCFSAFFILHKALLSCAPPSPGPGALPGAIAQPGTDSSTGRARSLSRAEHVCAGSVPRHRTLQFHQGLQALRHRADGVPHLVRHVLVQPGHGVADPGQKQAMPNRLSRIEAPAQRLGFFDSCQVAWDGAE